SESIHYPQLVSKSRGYLPVEELYPLRLADALLGLISGTEAKVEFGVDPALCLSRMRGIADEGGRNRCRGCRNGLMRATGKGKPKYGNKQEGAKAHSYSTRDDGKLFYFSTSTPRQKAT